MGILAPCGIDFLVYFRIQGERSIARHLNALPRLRPITFGGLYDDDMVGIGPSPPSGQFAQASVTMTEERMQ
ncbi:hypothetical protein J1614_004576 [Plenodomus biglobosus]|nr:hypothetical protein J1614_004576 [Plenodomus biglobosus]